MEENIVENAAVNITQKKRRMKKERRNRVVLERLTSIALKMREIRKKASQPKSVELN